MEKEKGLPEDWRERIRGKKVFFYNTSIGNLLNGGEKHINKIAHVLETFRIHKEVTLWWRPHPLELSTVESMRPELATKYKALRRRYEEEGWGILDTSADVNRAIAISDAYYGDWSSVMHLYQKTGKPILISDDVVKDGICIQIMDMLFYKKKLWFVAQNCNLLFNMDTKSNEIELIGKIPCDNILCSSMINEVIREGDNLIFIPANASSVIKYNISTRKFLFCDVGENKQSKYIGCAKIGEHCYLIPAYENKVLKYNMNENKIEKEIPIVIQSITMKCRRRTLVDEKYFYFVCEKSNIIGKYDTSSDKIEYVHLDEKNNYIYFIEKYKENYWVISQNYITILDLNLKYEAVLAFPKEFVSEEILFIDYIKDEKMLYLLPYLSNMILAVNMETKSIVSINGKKDYAKKYVCGSILDRSIYAFSNYDNCLYEMSLDGINEKKHKLYLTKTQINDLYDIYKEEIINSLSDSALYENGLLNLKYFIEVIKTIISNDSLNYYKTQCGEKIHKKMMGE